MINMDDQLNLLKAIGIALPRRVECIVIGGSAMMFYNAKTATKDVDLVFLSRKELLEVKDVLNEMGFDEKRRFSIFKHYEDNKEKPVMMEGRGTRFDLFDKKIICFELSQKMIERVKEVHEFGNLIVKIVAPEDIILLKCATDREKDRADAVELIKRFNIDWNIIIDESIAQTRIAGDVFPVYLYDFLTELKEDLQADIPKDVIKKIRKIAEDEMAKILKEGKKKEIKKKKKKA